MKIHLENNESGYVIQGYAPGEIRLRVPSRTGLDVRIIRHSLLVVPERFVEWAPQSFDELTAEHFTPIAELNPEVILLGSGSRMRLPTTPLIGALAQLGVGFEVMDTGAACRTYNLLAGEGRRVVAALIVG